MSSVEEVFLVRDMCVSCVSVSIFVSLRGKVEEVDSSVSLVVEILRVVKHKTEVHIGREVLAVEVVIPSSTFRDHEES